MKAILDLDVVARGFLLTFTIPGLWGGWYVPGTEGSTCEVTANMIDFEHESLQKTLEASLHTLLTKRSWTKCDVTKLLMLPDEALRIQWGSVKDFPF